MKFTYESLDLLSEEYGLDINEVLTILGDPPYTDEYGEDYWILDDVDANQIPDILQELIGNPIITNPSQGGILG